MKMLMLVLVSSWMVNVAVADPSVAGDDIAKAAGLGNGKPVGAEAPVAAKAAAPVIHEAGKALAPKAETRAERPEAEVKVKDYMTRFNEAVEKREKDNACGVGRKDRVADRPSPRPTDFLDN